MSEYGWILPVGWLFLSIGAAMVLSAWIVHDKHRTKRIKQMVMTSDSWCQENCRHLHECSCNHKDPDDVWKELEDYCYSCPMALAIDEWEQKESMKERSRKNV